MFLIIRMFIVYLHSPSFKNMSIFSFFSLKQVSSSRANVKSVKPLWKHLIPPYYLVSFIYFFAEAIIIDMMILLNESFYVCTFCEVFDKSF